MGPPLTNDSIRQAVRDVLDLGYPYLHPIYGLIAYWDVRNVTTMRDMFSSVEGAVANLNFNGDLSRWDVSNVKTMEGMFAVEATGESFTFATASDSQL